MSLSRAERCKGSDAKHGFEGLDLRTFTGRLSLIIYRETGKEKYGACI